LQVQWTFQEKCISYRIRHFIEFVLNKGRANDCVRFFLLQKTQNNQHTSKISYQYSKCPYLTKPRLRCDRGKRKSEPKEEVLLQSLGYVLTDLSRTKSRVSGSLTTDAVRPTALLPLPEV
jgi:hypothetical protein